MLFMVLLLFGACGAVKEVIKPKPPEMMGMEGLLRRCMDGDTIESILISKAEAILMFDKERYEVNITLYSKKDSILYLSAVNNGFEILRASVERDSIKVISRMNKIVYHSPLKRRFGYQYPVNFDDLQNLISAYYLCNELDRAHDDMLNHLVFDMDENHIKKRVSLNRIGGDLSLFEFYHQKTDRYIMGERIDNAFKIYSNFMITEFEIIASGGIRTYNKKIKVNMEVNPRRYTFTELR